MAVLSVLRSFPKFKVCSNLQNNAKPKFFLPRRIVIGSKRWMSDKRTFTITPSTYMWKLFWDSVHFYAALGLIPLGILVFCVNIFIGPAELAEIPEGYEPQRWEYFQHPISRFFAKYFYPNPQQDYEKYMHFINEEDEKRLLQRLDSKVQGLMAERGDYKAWYYVPITGKYSRYVLHVGDQAEERGAPGPAKV